MKQTAVPPGLYQGRRTVNIVQAAAMAGVSRRTIHHWIQIGRVQTIRSAGGRQRIFEESLYRQEGGVDNAIGVNR